MAATNSDTTPYWSTSTTFPQGPCHGSRFKPTGEVISGPAEAPLPEAD